MIQDFKDLIVWQKSIDLVVIVYEVTSKFPKEEIFGLVSQMRRAAVSIPSNIAEGRCRKTRKDFAQFLRMSLGSAGELETQIIVCKKLPRIRDIDFGSAENHLVEIMKMLNVMIRKLSV